MSSIARVGATVLLQAGLSLHCEGAWT